MLVALSEAQRVRTRSCCYLEGSIVSSARLEATGEAEFGALLDAFGIEIVSFRTELAMLVVVVGHPLYRH